MIEYNNYNTWKSGIRERRGLQTAFGRSRTEANAEVSRIPLTPNAV